MTNAVIINAFGQAIGPRHTTPLPKCTLLCGYAPSMSRRSPCIQAPLETIGLRVRRFGNGSAKVRLVAEVSRFGFGSGVGRHPAAIGGPLRRPTVSPAPVHRWLG